MELGLTTIVPVWYRTTGIFIPPLSKFDFIMKYEIHTMNDKFWITDSNFYCGSRLKPIGSKTLLYHGVLNCFMGRRDSIFPAFCLNPAATGRGLCDIDSL